MGKESKKTKSIVPGMQIKYGELYGTITKLEVANNTVKKVHFVVMTWSGSHVILKPMTTHPTDPQLTTV